MGRHAPKIVVAAFGVILIIAVVIFRGGGDDTPADPDSPITAPTLRPGCEPLTVVVSPEKFGIMRDIASVYNGLGRGDDTDCVTVDVRSGGSGTVEAALVTGWDPALAGSIPQPDVWSPAGSTWLELLRHDQAQIDQPTQLDDEASLGSVTTTPLVIAMPRPMAEALGWPDTPIGWTEIRALANNPEGWASAGHPEWGDFKLGKTNPNISTSGLAATIGQLVAATGRSSDLTSADIANPDVRQALADTENAVAHYGDTTLTFAASLLAADDVGQGLKYVGAVALEAKSVADYNAGNPSGDPKTLGDHAPPSTPLVAIWPREGTMLSDSPYAIINHPGMTEQKRVGAADYLSYLHEDEQQQEFTDAGFNGFDGSPNPGLVEAGNLVPSDADIVLNTPSAQVLADARAAWEELRKRARALLLIDVSGSMEQPVSGSDTTSRIEKARQAAIDALPQLTDTDEVGLWVFTDDLPGGSYEELVPVGPLSETRQRLQDELIALEPLRGTPLYSATREAYAHMTDLADPDFITGVVLLTDGYNDPADPVGLAELIDGSSSYTGLKRASLESDVRIFSVAYGEGADLATLRLISEATRAKAYDATAGTNIGTVFTNILSNF